MDSGPEEVTDTVMKGALAAQARRVQVKSLITAALLTALTLLI